MEDSILKSVKDYLGLNPDDTAFDTDVIMSINAILFVLPTIGVGSEPYVVEDASDEQSDLLGDDPIGGVQQYGKMRTRMLFDPPTNNHVMNALTEQIAEFEWRIMAEADRRATEGV